MGIILLRYAEVALKGGNRSVFLRRLRRNIRAALREHGIEGDVTSEDQRIIVRTDDVEPALEPLSRVFGLSSLSPAITVERTMEAIAAECVRQAKLAGLTVEQSFRVRSRRADKTFPVISPEIDRLAGEAIWNEIPARVDLSRNADVTIGVEITRDQVLVFGRTLPAPGGLPVGIEGNVVALISGGIDSPVAAWMMMKRGCGVIPVHFCQNEVEKRKALDNVEQLRRYSYGFKLRPIILDHNEAIAPTLQRLYDIGDQRWTCIFCKRTLLERAAALAEQYHAHAIVMGDSLGQVASQTLPNMEIISYGITKPILRPLIGLDKDEIIDIARRIGTFDISIREAESCPFLPTRPMTRGTMERFRHILRRLAPEDDEAT